MGSQLEDSMTFHEHIQECEQCRHNPFGLCQAGARLLLLGDTPERQPEREEDAQHATVTAEFGKN